MRNVRIEIKQNHNGNKAITEFIIFEPEKGTFDSFSKTMKNLSFTLTTLSVSLCIEIIKFAMLSCIKVTTLLICRITFLPNVVKVLLLSFLRGEYL